MIEQCQDCDYRKYGTCDPAGGKIFKHCKHIPVQKSKEGKTINKNQQGTFKL